MPGATRHGGMRETSERAHYRLRPDRHRPGRRVRLRRHAGLQGDARRGRAQHPRQLEPGHDHDRPRRRGRRLHRAADGARARTDHRPRAPRRAAADARRARPASTWRSSWRRPGILEKYNVRLLGTPLEAIRRAEDRELFRDMLAKLGEPVLESEICHTLDECVAAADADRAAGGHPARLHARRHRRRHGLHDGATADGRRPSGLAASPITQVLVEKNLLGWKEVEYEVMRDGAGNCITICNMENLDPMGVHTGDSIVVAPSQTLSDKDYQMLRSAALRIITELGIEGGCNVQFSLAPRKDVRDWDGDPDDAAAVPRHRGEPARFALVRAGLEGDRLPDRAGGSEDRLRQDARPDPERRDAEDDGRVRTRARLLRGEDPALAVRQVRARRPRARHADEGDRRGDGHRPLVRGGAEQGRALARSRRARACSGSARSGANGGEDCRCTRRTNGSGR